MRYALGIEYDGSKYCGWQRQNNVIGVQQKIEEALSKIANEPIEVICAGRTDTGVNATNQIIHFDTDKVRKDVAWTLGVNTNLPKDIAVSWVKEVNDEFHARFSATARRYRYLIYNKPVKQGLMHDQFTWIRNPLDEQLMDDAAKSLLGENDFTSFRAKDCQSHTPFRNIHQISVKRFGDIVMIEVQANAFLYHMIRNIAGVLIPIGMGKKPVSWTADLLKIKDRSKAGVTAHSDGLYFVGVDYPEKFGIPSEPWGPVFVEPWLCK